MMRTTRQKLLAIVAIATLALSVMAGVGLLSTREVGVRLQEIQTRIVPRIALRPRLESELERLARAFQDAVAAEDLELLAAVEQRRAALLSRLAQAELAVDQAAADALRAALDRYYTAAADVSRRLIAGETGDDVVGAMREMQTAQAQVRSAIEEVSMLRDDELESAFAETVRLQEESLRLRLGTALACMLLVMLLTFWISRQLLRSVAALSAGFERFGRGDFAQPIAVHGDDELAQAGKRANEMAASLDRLSRARDRTLFIGEGLNGLAEALRGELTPEETAERATAHLARYLGAPAAALYYRGDDAELRLLAGYAAAGEGSGFAQRFGPGEGLVGQAARTAEPTVVEPVPPDHFRIRSGLGESAPRALLLLPLVPSERVSGVLELAFLKEVPAAALELLSSAQRSIAVALVVARARAATRALLEETQAQADRLTQQEEELRATNEELEAQQEELRQTNEELTQQSEALAAQRKVLQESNRELEDARRALEHHASELATVSAYKSQFLTNMSHELRTPLNSMLLLSSLLAENASGSLSEQEVGYCRTIHGAGQDLLALINQILDLAKVEAGKVELELERVELGALLDHVAGQFTPVARDKGLELELELEAGLPPAITTDRQRVRQILSNLIGNALKFTESGSVSLRFCRPARGRDLGRDGLDPATTVSFEVSDTGPGISPEHQTRVFGAFEQADASVSARHGGTGLGLAIARELAERLGGALLLESTSGRGSTFTCHLPERGPAAVPQRQGHGAPAVAASAASAARADVRRAGLLVVEDDAVFADRLVELIREQGHEAWVAADGEVALKLARKHRPRGIILDLMLPDIDGWTVLERLRADPETASIPVHCVSGLDGAARAARLGAAGYVRKPATREDLLRVVQSLAPRTSAGATSILVVEDDAVLGDSLLAQLAKQSIEAVRVGTAEAAECALRERSFDCLILDLGLPDMDGLELLSRLDRTDCAKLPAVIVYTARALTMAETRRLESYADAIVLKDGPSLERLLNEIRMFARRLSAGRRPAPAGQPTSAGSDLAGRAVLVVDDDMRTVYALSAMLRAKGFEVHVADTGAAALDALAAHPDIDAVLMDIMMPEMDGYTAMQRIRAQERFARLPIIALTAMAMKGDEERCLAAGASAYVPKPVDSELLLDTLRAQIVEAT